jgi:hypothetical protein
VKGDVRRRLRRTWDARGGRSLCIGAACLAATVPAWVLGAALDVPWQAYYALVALPIIGVELFFLGSVRRGRWLAGLGIILLLVTVTAVFTTDWPFYGRTGADDACVGFNAGAAPRVPSGHALVYRSEDKQLLPPGISCTWRECVAHASKNTCAQQVGTRSTFVRAKASSYLVLLGGSALTVALLVGPVALFWLMLSLARRAIMRHERRSAAM